MMDEDPRTRMMFNGKLHRCMAFVLKNLLYGKSCILHRSACFVMHIESIYSI